VIAIPENTVKWFRTGSSYICFPPVTHTDYDIVLYVLPEHFGQYMEDLLADDWERGGSRNEQSEWASFKKTEGGVLYNFIVTQNETHYNNMYIATSIAKRLNLMRKPDRVMLFHAIVDGEVPIVLEGAGGIEDELF
jgi:hypothetical protein